MSKVSPEASKKNSLVNLAFTENDIKMGSTDNTTTSFSSAPHPNYNTTAPTEKVNSFYGDSLYNKHDSRFEVLDITEQSLHQIARDGNTMMMKAVLKSMPYPSVTKKKINKKDSDKFTPLHYAARYNHYDMCELLVKSGANLHSRGDDQLTPLHMVARYKPKKEKIYGAGDGDRSDMSSEEEAKEQQEANVKILTFLIDNGAGVNDKDFYGLTPLHHACLRGNEACVDNLLQCKGISIEPKDQQEMTPLHACAVYGHVNLAKVLIESGANVRVRDGDEGTPLQYAAAEGKLEIVQLIIDQCIKTPHLEVSELLDESDSDGNTPLHLAVDNGHLEVTNYLIDMYLLHKNSSGLNARLSNRETPLHIAAKHGHFDIVKVLVEKGAKINSRNDSLQTPLFLAAQFNHNKVIKFLIECGANIELHDTDQYTALLVAASYGHSEAIQILLENKANMLAVDKNDKNIIYICAEENRVEALQVLLKLKEHRVKTLFNVTDRYDNTPLHVAASNGHLAIVKILLDNGAIIDRKNEDEQTPLHLAAENGSVKIVKEMVNRQREIVHDDDENGNTALHLAALAGRAACVRELVRLGANTIARNTKEWTPLDCCASAGMHKSAVILLEADAPVDPKDKRKQTPLHLACVWGHRRMVEILLQWGADVTHRAVTGKNALDFAIDFGRSECAAAIIESDRWREALENRSFDFKHDQFVGSPMRKLIRKMPSIAIEVFRKCLEDNGKNKDDPRYRITFDYEFLDDEFSCKQWCDEDESTAEIDMPSNETKSSASGEVYDDDGRVLKSAVPYTTQASLLRDNHPLSIMVKSKRVDLLRHPLVISLLNHKWRAYGRTVYYANLFIYALFLAVFNSYALTTPPPFAVDFTSTTPASPCAFILPDAQRVWGADCRFPTVWQRVSTYIIIVLAGLGLLKELYQMATQRLTYLKSFTNFIEVGAYVLAILLVIDIGEYGRNSGIRETWQWQVGAAGIFLSWMGLLLFIQNFPTFGIFVLMFTDIFWTFASFFFVFLLFILGFAFSFHLLLQNQFAFNFWWNSIVKTSVMMIGEFDYDAIFNADATSTAYTDQLQYEGITYTIFVIFIIIMSIIIVNLLVGLAVDDIKEVQDNAKLESLAMQVSLALDIEYTLPLWFRRRYMKKTRSFSPNQYRHTNPITRWLHSESHLNHDTIEEALNPEKTDLQNMEQKIDGVQGRLRDLRNIVSDMNDRSRQVESIVQAIAKHYDLNWDENDDDKENAA